MTTYAGGCRCSAVRYETEAEPMAMLQCQCQECQHATGSGHGDWVIFPAAQLKILGKPAKFNRPTDSGAAFSQEFCKDCGSPLFGRPSSMPEGIGVLAGSLDDPSIFKPQIAVYTARGHAWDTLDPAVAKFPKMPPPRQS
jgi:hypothetical protein